MSIIVCSGPERDGDAYRCPCCGFESPDINDFAMATCWPCAFGDNFDCPGCVARGVWVSNDIAPRTKGHRFSRWDGDVAVTSCGYRIVRVDLGNASDLGSPDCKRCWREADQAP